MMFRAYLLAVGLALIAGWFGWRLRDTVEWMSSRNGGFGRHVPLWEFLTHANADTFTLLFFLWLLAFVRAMS